MESAMMEGGWHMNHETEEKRMKLMRKTKVEKLDRETSSWMTPHDGNRDLQV